MNVETSTLIFKVEQLLTPEVFLVLKPFILCVSFCPCVLYSDVERGEVYWIVLPPQEWSGERGLIWPGDDLMVNKKHLSMDNGMKWLQLLSNSL